MVRAGPTPVININSVEEIIAQPEMNKIQSMVNLARSEMLKVPSEFGFK